MPLYQIFFFREISYSLIFPEPNVDCNTINEFNEGVEFSVYLSSYPQEWIPLKFSYYRLGINSSEILIGDINDFHLRGYDASEITTNDTNRKVLHVCGFNSSDFIQFRWLQTSQLGIIHVNPKDVWILDDININLVLSEEKYVPLVNESFESANLR